MPQAPAQPAAAASPRAKAARRQGEAEATTAGRQASAAASYRVSKERGAPANDATPARRMPALHRRGLHIDPSAPVHLIRTLDWIVIAAAAEFAARWGAGASLLQMSVPAAWAFMIAALCLKAGLWLTGAYRATPASMRVENGLAGLTLGSFLSLAAANALAPSAHEAGALSATLPAAAMLLAGVHAALALAVRAAWRRGVFAERIVIVGATAAAERFMRRVHKNGEAHVVALVDDRSTRAPKRLGSKPVGGDLDALAAWAGLPFIDRIVVAVTPSAEARIGAIMAQLHGLPHRIDLLLGLDPQAVHGRGFSHLGGAALACISGGGRDFYRALVKRALDVTLAGALVLFLAPLLLTIAAAVKMSSKGPVLHRQRRYGLSNRIITLIKFRTMREAPDAPLAPADPDDPRITRVGRWLRRSNLDALPLLFNVLRGDMSLVGPHPHLLGLRHADSIARYAHRHRVKPGLTGWAQINGAPGMARTPSRLRKHVQLDLDYAARASLWLDAQILARTIFVRRSR